MEDDYRRSCDVALVTSEPPRKVSKQCFHLYPKIREIDGLMTPSLEARVYEAHPELAFWCLDGERPMVLPKKVKSRPHPPGMDERAAVLVRHGYDHAFLDQKLPRGIGRDDLLDAAVLALTAARIARGEGRSFPFAPERDGKVSGWRYGRKRRDQAATNTASVTPSRVRSSSRLPVMTKRRPRASP